MRAHKNRKIRFFFWSSLCPVSVSTGHVVMRTRVQDWTHVRISDHWTEAPPFCFIPWLSVVET